MPAAAASEKKTLVDGDAPPLDNEAGGSKKDHGRAPSWASLAFKRACRDFLIWADKGIDFAMEVFHIFMKILGPCLMTLALGLISFVTYTFFWYFIPTIEVLGLPGQVGLSLIGLFLETNTLYNYMKSVFMNAGTPPEYEEVVKELQKNNEENGTAFVKPRKCPKCNPARVKPIRAHHCSICRCCVLKMDHHCPWINNCVGHCNYRHFCLFLLFLATSCCFIVACFAQPFSQTMFFGRRRRPTTMSYSGRQCIMTSFMICCSILVALCILGGFHVFLVLTNQTTIEFQTNLIRKRDARKNGEFYRNPYDLGRSRNFQQVFGPNAFWSFRWALPWWTALPPTGDGTQFHSLNSMSTEQIASSRT